MPDSTPLYRKSFEENIDILSEELKLAAHWGRPSILLAVHKSIPSQVKAEKALENKLKKDGQKVVRIEVNPQSPDVSQIMLKENERDKTVFFVSNIDRGGGEDGKEAYRALNIYRELFVENQIKAVFWLTVNEALTLPRHAPDFWAFRHRVIEFSSPHATRKTRLPAGILIWHIQSSSDPPGKTKEKISSRERLLKELPDRPESLSTRLELLYTLGYLYWVLGDTRNSLQSLALGVKLAENRELSRIRSWLLNGTAILSYEAGEYQKAFEIYSKLVTDHSEDGILWMNISATLCALGRNSDSVSHGKRALKISPSHAGLWNTQGYLYVSMGKLDEAASCFKRALDLAPANAHYYESLAACYSLMGLQDEAIQQLRAAREHSGDPALPDVYREAILGEPEKSAEMLKSVLVSGQISKLDIRRDPNIHILLDDALINPLL